MLERFGPIRHYISCSITVGGAVSSVAFLPGESEMARLILAVDWSPSLGPIANWPASLKTTVGLMLRSPVPLVLLWGPDGIMLYNDAYGGFAGKRHPGLLGAKVLEGWPEAADLNTRVMSVCMAGGTLQYKDERLVLNRRGTPEEAWMDLFYSPVIDESGRPGGVIAMVVETTERVLAVAALEKNEARLRFLDGLSEAIATSQDADAILTITTRLVGEYLGVSICAYADMDPDEDGFTIRGDWSAPGSASIVGHYSLADFGRKAVRELSEGQPLIINDNLRELEPGEAATFQSIGIGATICMPLVKKGRLTALMAIHHKSAHVWTDHELALIREVTERSWAHIERVRDEVARRESAERLRLAAHAAQIGTFDFNPASGELVWDDRCKELFGLPPTTSITYDVFLSGLHPDDRERVAAAVKNALDPEVRAPYDIEYRTQGIEDGVQRWIAATGHVFFRDGAAVRFVGTVLDVSTQKEAAAALQDLNATLEKRVEQRTSQLRRTEEALRHSQKMEAVGQLTGGIAHDFNNLLQGITGALERAQRRIEIGRTPEAERYIKMAVDSASRAAALTHRLLAFSRRQTLDPRPTDINRLIAGMEDLIRRTMGPDVSVEVVGAGGLWAVHVDISQLENSLLNLCINARDAMPDGGKLTIETANKWLDDRSARERDLPPGQYVSLCVTDTGTGMTPDVIARAFDPFFTTKPMGRGTGLGLSMIYGFARQSGGQVRIYSEAGRGTTMCLYFPRHLGEVEEEEPKPGEFVERGFGETVLVVDDEEDIRMLIAEVLSENSYSILEAIDGASALKILAGKRPVHLLITDVGLPGGMNGRQLAEAARLARKDLKVLFITGYAENAAVGSGHLEPGMEVLAKPFAMSTLANKVREMLE